jgi:hypothetical protein
MAKHGKTLPARRQRQAFDSSLLIRSAESLGRVIGSLQRQLDGAAKRVIGNADEGSPTRRSNNGAAVPRKTTTVKKTTRTRVAKATPARKTSAGRAVKAAAGQTGARKKSVRKTRPR